MLKHFECWRLQIQARWNSPKPSEPSYSFNGPSSASLPKLFNFSKAGISSFRHEGTEERRRGNLTGTACNFEWTFAPYSIACLLVKQYPITSLLVYQQDVFLSFACRYVTCTFFASTMQQEKRRAVDKNSGVLPDSLQRLSWAKRFLVMRVSFRKETSVPLSLVYC